MFAVPAFFVLGLFLGLNWHRFISFVQGTLTVVKTLLTIISLLIQTTTATIDFLQRIVEATKDNTFGNHFTALYTALRITQEERNQQIRERMPQSAPVTVKEEEEKEEPQAVPVTVKEEEPQVPRKRTSAPPMRPRESKDSKESQVYQVRTRAPPRRPRESQEHNLPQVVSNLIVVKNTQTVPNTRVVKKTWPSTWALTGPYACLYSEKCSLKLRAFVLFHQNQN